MADIDRFGIYPRFLRKLPGFRSGVWWHSVIASLYYLMTLLCLFIAFTSYNRPAAGILVAFIIFCTFAVPVPVIFDMGNWTEKFGFIKNRSEKEKRKIKILICIFSFFFSFALALIFSDAADGFSYK